MYKMFEISKKKSIFTIWIHYFLYNNNLINWLLDRFALRSIRGVFWYKLRNFTRCEGFVRHFYRVSRVLSQTPPAYYPRGQSLWINRWRLLVSLSNIHPYYLSYLNTIHLSLNPDTSIVYYISSMKVAFDVRAAYACPRILVINWGFE